MTVHCLFNVGGTGNVLLINGSPWGPLGVGGTGGDWGVFNLLNPDLWVTKIVTYPAAAFPMNQSIDDGVEILIDEINDWSGPFGLMGASQGAAVISKVYDELRSGSLTSRRDDLVAGVTFGNIMREAGHTIDHPGAIDPGGHGIFPADKRLVGTEKLWWDFANPGDVAACNGDDTASEVLESVLQFLNANWTGNGSLLDFIGAHFTDPAYWFDLFSLFQILQRQFSVIASADWPHTKYGELQPIAGDSRYAPQVAADYLNAVAGGAWQPSPDASPPAIPGVPTWITTPPTIEDLVGPVSWSTTP